MDFTWIALALVAGVLVRHFLSRRRDSDLNAHAVSVSDFITAMSTVAILVLAFVLVAAFESFADARDASASEADQVVLMAHHAAFLPADRGNAMVTDLACYSRAVQYREWPAMREQSSSASVAHWLAAFRDHVDDANGVEGIQDFVEMQSALNSNRRSRLEDALPSVPPAMYLFMGVTVALTVFAMALFTDVSRRTPGHVFLLVATSLTLAGSLALVHDIDSAYSGPSRLMPTAMHGAEKQVMAELDAADRKALPCDKRGVPDIKGFTPRSIALR